MKATIVYVLVSSDKDLYLEELWVSLFSLRLFHPTVSVKVLADAPTAKRILQKKTLAEMITEIVTVSVPEQYSPKQRSRQIKTTIREIIEGDYLFIDTDTVITKPLDDITNSEGDILAVPDGHLPLSECLFPPLTAVKNIFNDDCSDSKHWYNSGVMLVRDNELTHQFYKRWNENWTYSCFEKGNSQDQPSLLKTDKEFGYIIKELPGIYNAQVAMSLKYFADAAIVHWWHMSFIENQDFSPYFSLSIYKEIKEANAITPHVEELIRNCKQSFVSPSMPVGKEHILFLFSPAGKTFNRIYKEGGAASWLMTKLAGWLDLLHKHTKKR